MDTVDISRLTAEELWARLLHLARMERGAICDLVETLAEIDRRGLYKDHEYVSLFECCVHKLGLSEAASYRRIRAARAIKLFPPIGPLLRQGRLTLESVALLHPFLNDIDAGTLVAQASGKRVWEVERLVAMRRTEAPRRDVVRFVPTMALETTPSQSLPDAPLLNSLEAVPTSPPQTASVTPQAAPASPGVRIAFTADEEFFKLLRQAQAVMRHKYPNGRLDGVFRDALQALLRKKTPWAFRQGAARNRAHSGD